MRVIPIALALFICLGFSAHSASVVVNTLVDEDNGNTASIANLISTPGGAGISLREAITAANNTPGADTITYSVSGTISVSGSALPFLSGGGTTINGAGQTVRIDGNGSPAGDDGIVITSAGNVIQGVTFTRFRFGIFVNGAGASGNSIIDCKVGTDGVSAFGNTSDGIRVLAGAAGNQISNSIISGNTGTGIAISGSGSDGNTISGCRIGLNSSGDAAVPNNDGGIRIYDSSKNNVIGGASSLERNVISGNLSTQGIMIQDAGSSNNTVVGNYIGTNSAGTSGISNAGGGIRIYNNAANNVIGGDTPAEGNLISGNLESGMRVETNGNTITGNMIGVDVSGSSAIPNPIGIRLLAPASNNQVGGAASGTGNLISGNTTYGLVIEGSGSSGNLVRRNSFGLNGSGNPTLPNSSGAVQIFLGASGNFIGSLTSGEGNVITGGLGVLLDGATTLQNRVWGNSIYSSSSGIQLNNGANATMLPAVINSVDFNAGTVSGIGASNGDTVSVYADATSYARYYLGSVVATGASWTLTGLDLNQYAGLHFTNIRTSAAGNSSEISTRFVTHITVSTLNDVVDGNTSSPFLLLGNPGGAGISLREAITAANNQSGTKNISFGLSGTITISSSQLPTLTSGGITIDGTGQNVRIDGNGLGGLPNGITITSANNVVRALTITRFGNDGVYIQGSTATGNKVEGCRIGTDGAVDLGNAGTGVVIFSSASGNTIGGATAAQRNIISGNAAGITIVNSAHDNLVQGNYIGTNAAGTVELDNDFFGVDIHAAAYNNLIGGDTPGERNVISGNGGTGVHIYDAGSTGNVISGNYIGVNAAGDSKLSNGIPAAAHGVQIELGANGNRVGGDLPGEGNLISGNEGGAGVWLDGVASTVVAGNIIGLNASGNSSIRNGNVGVMMKAGANNNLIGGQTAGARNVISGNNDYGVVMQEAGTTQNRVEGNYIGLNAAGTTGVANGQGFNGDGVLIRTGATDNVVGGALPGTGNVISGNVRHGVRVADASSTGNAVRGNYIGTNAAGNAAVPNGIDGVRVESAASNTIGGVGPGAGNVISGNTNHGVGIVGATATGVNVQGNFIGLAADGVTALANGADGVNVDTASSATIGGTVAAARNRIGENGNDGVEVNAGTGNAVRQNYIYSNGGDGISLKNGGNTTQPAPVLNPGVNPINGTGEVGAVVDIFADLQDEGRVYLASTNVSGDSTFTSFTDLSSFTGFNLTATQTDASGNTSPFTAPRLIAAVPPAAPSDLRATAGAAQIDLVWNPSTVFNLRGYNVYRRVNGSGPFSKIASLLSAPSYIDTAVVAGTIYNYHVKAENSTGLESLASNEASARAGNIDLSVPSVPAAPGEEARFTLNFVNLTGINPQGIDITISYPLSIRDARPVTVESTATTRNVLPAYSVTSSAGVERIRIVNITTGTTLTGQGSMFEFVVPIAASAPLGCHTLTLSNIALIGPNGPLNATPTNGSICVETGIDCNESRVNGDLDGSGAINVADVLIAHRMVLKLQTSPDCQGSSADLDGDGRVNVRDAQKVHRLTLSKKSLESSAEKASEVNVEVDIVQADIGDIVNVPVYIDGATDLAAAHLIVAFPFNPLKLEFLGISTGALTAAAPAFTFETNSSDNSAQISMSRETGIPNGGGELAVLLFKVLAGAEPGESLPIRLSAVELTDSLSGDFAWSSTVNMEDGAILISGGEGEEGEGGEEPVPVGTSANITLAIVLSMLGIGMIGLGRRFRRS